MLEGAHLESCKTGKEFSLLNIDEHRGLLSRWEVTFLPYVLKFGFNPIVETLCTCFTAPGTDETSRVRDQTLLTSLCLCYLTLLLTGLVFFRLANLCNGLHKFLILIIIFICCSLQVFIRTANNVLIEINPATRIPRL